MRRRLKGAFLAALALAGCETDGGPTGVGGAPAPPRGVEASYYAGTVTVTWELAPAWDGETFRVYGRRSGDADYSLVAEVTSCAAGVCSYADVNVQSGRSYDYYVSAVDPRSGIETASEYAVQVAVPQPVPPPVPDGVAVVALDGANYLSWGPGSRAADDFAFYRVYLMDGDGATYLLGDTDSEGFLDQLAENGLTYTYFVSAVDDQGHESAGSPVASGTPRPDYTGEWIYDDFDQPSLSGFRFPTSESVNPVVAGSDPQRHFRLETDASGWWLVPGPQADVYPQAWQTTALKCGVAADADCVALESAPTSGYVHEDIELIPQSTYTLRVRGDDGQNHYGVVRVVLLGIDQDDNGLMIFDWAYQLQPGNPTLAPRAVILR